MANELQLAYVTSKTVYFQIRDRVGNIWDTISGTFTSYFTVNYTNFTISATEQGTASGYYVGTFPAAIAPGIYSVTARQRLTGTPAESDPILDGADYNWGGVATVPLSDLATSGQLGLIAPLRIFRGQQVTNFMFKLVSSLDHVTPFTSGVCSGQISKDGSAFAALQSGAFTEVGLGFYRVQALTSGDLLGNVIAINFKANGISGGSSDPRDYVILTQRTSGQ